MAVYEAIRNLVQYESMRGFFRVGSHLRDEPDSRGSGLDEYEEPQGMKGFHWKRRWMPCLIGAHETGVLKED